MRELRAVAARPPILGGLAVLLPPDRSAGMSCPSLAARRRRMSWAIFTIALLSLADLYFTLLYARTIGMSEVNPIARQVMAFNSPALLTLWKCATVSGACLIFWFLRHKRAAEVAAWGCGAVLMGLAVWWSAYTNTLPTCAPGLDELRELESHSWVMMHD